MNKKRKELINSYEVSELHELSIGNHMQKVLFEGKKRNLPIVITLHGGPGFPVPFSVGCRGLFPEFTDHFLMVYWDQLGCGINDYPLDESFTIDHFVNMTIDLIHEIKKFFPKNKVYLFAMSWGSVLSTKVLEKEPRIVDGVLAYGQIIRRLFINENVYGELEQSKISRSKLEKIKRMTPKTIQLENLKLISGSIRKYTNGYINKKGKQAPLGPILKGILSSPDYSLKDFKAMMLNNMSYNMNIWRELLQVNLMRTLSCVQVPYVMLQGDTDIITPSSYVSEMTEMANNPNLSFRIVPNSGHNPGEEGMHMVLKELHALVEN